MTWPGSCRIWAVSIEIESLPSDPEILRPLLLGERARHAELLEQIVDERDAALSESGRLRAIIEAMQRHRFGRRSEQLNADQLGLGLEDTEQALAAADAKEENQKASPARTSRRRVDRGALPAHLPRVETLIDIEHKACPCCAGELHRIGEDVAERLDVIPAQFRVLVVRRPKYACRACLGTVLQAPAPHRLIEGGLPTEGLIAHVIVGEYADHLPLYRQAHIYARQGIELDRSTLADWVERAAWFLRPLHERLLDHLRASLTLFADETTAPVLDPGRGKTKTGQLWAYARDDRPWSGGAPPAVAYIYAPDRKAERPVQHLKGFRGILQVDGYAGYRVMAETVHVALAYCWEHWRRQFYEIANPGNAPIAREALARIASIYVIEAEIRGHSVDQRHAARQARIKPLTDDLKAWLETKLAVISQKGTLAKAIRYGLSRWQGFTLFIDDGRVEIDSNTVERAIRPITLNRKNALFSGSDGGGEHWAIPLIGSTSYCSGTTQAPKRPRNTAYIGKAQPWD